MHFTKGCSDGVVERYAMQPRCGSTLGNSLTGPQVKPALGAFHDPQYHGDGSKSGQTDNNLHRQVVVHQYRDRAQEVPNSCARRYDGATLFPVKLHKVLNAVQAEGLDHIVSWVSHGRCFRIHDAEAFVERVMPKYFRQSKMTSFQRQLHLYDFKRLTRGRDKGCYYHDCFLRGKPSLSYQMERVVIKGTRVKAVSNPDKEPNLYRLPVVDSKAPRDDASGWVKAARFESIPFPEPMELVPQSPTEVTRRASQTIVHKDGMLGWFHPVDASDENSAKCNIDEVRECFEDATLVL